MVAFIPCVGLLIISLLALFLEGNKYIKKYSASILGFLVIALGVFFYSVIDFSFSVESITHNISWFGVMGNQINVGFTINPINFILLISIIIYLATLYLTNAFKDNNERSFALVLAISFLSMAILSIDVVMIALAWFAISIIDCVKSKQLMDSNTFHNKAMYEGINTIIITCALLLLSILCESTDINTINKNIKFLANRNIFMSQFVGGLFVIAVIMRLRILPFLSNYKQHGLDRSVSTSMMQMLVVHPLAFITVIKLSYVMNIKIISVAFLVFGIATALLVLLFSLIRNSREETVYFLHTTSIGLVCALMGMGIIPAAMMALIFSISIHIFARLFMFGSQDNLRRTDSALFYVSILIFALYVGLPGSVNFFLFYDVALASMTSVDGSIAQTLALFLVFFLACIASVHLLSLSFDVKKIFNSSSAPDKNRHNYTSIIVPVALSLIMSFYIIPANLSEFHAYKFSTIVSKYIFSIERKYNTLQNQNIVMILLFFILLMGIVTGIYLYFLSNHKKKISRTNKVIEFLKSDMLLYMPYLEPYNIYKNIEHAREKREVDESILWEKIGNSFSLALSSIGGKVYDIKESNLAIIPIALLMTLTMMGYLFYDLIMDNIAWK